MRRVRQRLTVTALVPPPPPPTVAPSFGIEVVNDQVTLRGRLRDQSSADVLGLGAADVFGTDILVQLVRVDSDVQPAPWLSSAPQAFAALGDLETGSLTLRNRTATLRGVATSEEIRTAAARGVQNALGGDISLVNLIEVVPLGEATFLAEGSSGVVILSGEMPAQESIDRLMAAAEAAYGAGNVENALTVGRVASASWLGALPAVIKATTDLDPWVMSVERRIVRLEGEAGSEDAVARVRATATAAFPAGLTIISDISAPQVSAPPAEAQEVADQLTAAVRRGWPLRIRERRAVCRGDGLARRGDRDPPGQPGICLRGRRPYGFSRHDGKQSLPQPGEGRIGRVLPGRWRSGCDKALRGRLRRGHPHRE